MRLIARQILVTQETFDGDALGLMDHVRLFLDWARSSAMLADDEVPEEALLVDALSMYWGNVINGGHWQYMENGHCTPTNLDRVERCIAATGDLDHLRVIQEFRRLLALHPDWITRAIERGRKDSLPPEIYALDGIFSMDHDIPIWRGFRDWLRAGGVVRPTTPAEIVEAKAAILAAVPDFEARQQRAAAEKAAAEARDPHIVAAKELCAAAGIEFLGIYAGSHPDKNGVQWAFFKTSAGNRGMCIDGTRATLGTTRGVLTDISVPWVAGQVRLGRAR
jgi:hypothetical protein